jgi:hypothetical protein
MFKCKNLMSYGVKLSELFGTPKLLFKKALPGGCATPEGIFRVEPESDATISSQYQFAN